ncbi:hypothetical protein [uncultured Mediterranean phage uvMED]|nr:hypothetical protein [uncultured Mediterranean phage uvMED]
MGLNPEKSISSNETSLDSGRPDRETQDDATGPLETASCCPEIPLFLRHFKALFGSISENRVVDDDFRGSDAENLEQKEKDSNGGQTTPVQARYR